MDAQRLKGFFATLGPRLEMARKVDDELNSALAYRFNVLDYIRTSELGLSRVIADLLNPHANHGQKILFLNTFLRGLKGSSEKLDRPLDITRGYGERGWAVVEQSVRVEVERTIPNRRRLDISVDFEGTDQQRRCLAIENKPYAGDQRNQIRDYLNFMETTYGRREGNQPTNHLLIYLSPTGELPSERSVKKERLAREIEEYDFAVMGYSSEGVADPPEREGNSTESRPESPLLLDYTLANWFNECRRECEVERLRNFLRDAKAFCGQHFGRVAMPDTTQEQMHQFLAELDNMQIATEVHRCWPDVRAGIKTRFADRLVERISAHLERDRPQLGDLHCDHSVNGRDKQQWEEVRVSRGGGAWRVKGHPVKILMQAQRPGAGAWCIGVSTGDQLPEVRDVLSAQLSKALGTAEVSDHWPWYQWVPDRWRWWNPAVASLAQELEEDGNATDYFVERFGSICQAAVPIIDETIHRRKAGRL